MKYAVLSLSGGLDSSSLLFHLLRKGYTVKCYSFDYNQKHQVELERVKRQMAYINQFPTLAAHRVFWKTIEIADIFNESQSALTSDTEVPQGHYAEDNMKATVVENRNAIFSAIIYSKALAWSKELDTDVDICLGVHSGDHQIYPDCTPEFRDAINHAFKIGNWGSEKIHFNTPYMEGNKTTILMDLIRSTEELGMDYNDILSNTNTCYNPSVDGKSCGKCGSCIERVEAFINTGKKDPIIYIDPWDVVVDHTKAVLEGPK